MTTLYHCATCQTAHELGTPCPSTTAGGGNGSIHAGVPDAERVCRTCQHHGGEGGQRTCALYCYHPDAPSSLVLSNETCPLWEEES